MRIALNGLPQASKWERVIPLAGVGLELDDLPVLAAGFDVPLQEGMTIAIEPKIFFPERGGVGVENTYLITATGFENLTPTPEELITV